MSTKRRQCAQMIPGLPPTQCEADCFKAGRCTEHYNDWRAAREARGIEQREYRKTAKKNRRGRITPPVIRQATPVRKYTKKSVASTLANGRRDAAAVKRARKAGVA